MVLHTFQNWWGRVGGASAPLGDPDVLGAGWSCPAARSDMESGLFTEYTQNTILVNSPRRKVTKTQSFVTLF